MTNESNIQKIAFGEDPEAAAKRILEMMADLQAEAEKGKDESYDFTWVGKRKAKLEFAAPTDKILRPDMEQSVDFENSENLFITGDNLQALKLLQESYLGQVKMIYIDPPYNTGKDFVYHDNFRTSNAEYAEKAGEIDDDGNRLVKNEKSNGRYHSDWLTMMYPRLKLARNLLSDDGVIFISIDDNELANLKLLCDEVFGEESFVNQFVWQRAFAPKNDSKYASSDHDYVMCYAKNLSNFEMNKLPRTKEANERYKNYDNDPRGVWTSDNLTVKTYSASYDYPITIPSGRIVNPAHGSCWRISLKRFQELVADNRVWFGEDGNNVPRLKRFLSEVQNGMTASTLMLFKDVGHSQEGRQELKGLFDDKGFFDGPKPVRLLHHLMILANLDKDALTLDFFAGSGTTAHAVMQLNAEDGGNRKWILCQLDEKCDEKSEAFKAGYKTIDEISRERIRRAANQLKTKKKEETGDLFNQNNQENQINHSSDNFGFRALRIEDNNFKAVRKPLGEIKQGELEFDVDNLKKDRTPFDLLFACLTAMALELNRPLKIQNDLLLYDYNGERTGVIACFTDSVPEEMVKEIAKMKPLTALFKDSSFETSADKVNLYEHFRIVSPETKVKVI